MPTGDAATWRPRSDGEAGASGGGPPAVDPSDDPADGPGGNRYESEFPDLYAVIELTDEGRIDRVHVSFLGPDEAEGWAEAHARYPYEVAPMNLASGPAAEAATRVGPAVRAATDQRQAALDQRRSPEGGSRAGWGV